MSKGAISLTIGSQVQPKSDKYGRIGTVTGLMPVPTGGRGRPRTSVVVTYEDGVEEYGVRDLKLVGRSLV